VFIKKPHLESRMALNVHYSFNESPPADLLHGTHILTPRKIYWQLVDVVHQLHVQQPSTYEKPEAASAVLGSWWLTVCRPKHVELHINMEQ
jgi:hypothetical protein